MQGVYKRKPKQIWIASTNDRFEFPVFMCDTAKELGELIGMDGKKVAIYCKRYAEGVKASGEYIIRKVAN